MVGNPWYVSRIDAPVSHRILIIEDNEDASVSLGMLLRIEGQDVYRASNGEIALRIAQDVMPEVVLLDIELPDMDGYEVIGGYVPPPSRHALW